MSKKKEGNWFGITFKKMQITLFGRRFNLSLRWLIHSNDLPDIFKGR